MGKSLNYKAFDLRKGLTRESQYGILITLKV